MRLLSREICHLVLLLLLLLAVALNSSLTPFSAGSAYVPYNVGLVPSILPEGAYRLSGPDPTLSEDLRADEFLVAQSFAAEFVEILFACRFQIALVAAILGLFCLVLPIPVSWGKAPRRALYIFFYLASFYAILLVRWWGYG